MPDHPFLQVTRQMLVGALLDITGEQMAAAIENLDLDPSSDDYCFREDPDRDQAVAQFVGHHPSGDDGDPQVFVQSIALMSDATLHWCVANLGGTDPFQS